LLRIGEEVKMATKSDISPNSRADHVRDDATPFGRMLVAIDESPAAQAAVHLAAEWVGGPGADVRFLRVSEVRRQGGSGIDTDRGPSGAQRAPHLVVSAPTLGARNRQLVQGIAGSAADFDADVIVLGLDRPRLADHRLAPSLRDQLVRATDLPVLVAPSPPADGKRHHRQADHPDRDEERADAPHRYARV
jgi:nucleotide-binding universal stress UspA family protein